MRARPVVRALCVQVLLAIAVSQVGTVCPNPPVADQSIDQFISAPRALIASDSGTQKLEATTRRLVGTDAVLAADPVRFAEGTKGRCMSRPSRHSVRKRRSAGSVYPTHRQSDDLARTSTSATAEQRVSPIRWLA
jgi:hypothetical protein